MKWPHSRPVPFAPLAISLSLLLVSSTSLAAPGLSSSIDAGLDRVGNVSRALSDVKPMLAHIFESLFWFSIIVFVAAVVLIIVAVYDWMILTKATDRACRKLKRPISSRYYDLLETLLFRIRQEQDAYEAFPPTEDEAAGSDAGTLHDKLQAKGRLARLSRSAFLAAEACEEQVRDFADVWIRLVKILASSAVLVGFLGTLIAFSSLAPSIFEVATRQGDLPGSASLDGLEVVFYPAAAGILAALLLGIFAWGLGFVSETRLTYADRALRRILIPASRGEAEPVDPYSPLAGIEEAADRWRAVFEPTANKLTALCEANAETARGVASSLDQAKAAYDEAMRSFAGLADTAKPFKEAARKIEQGAEGHQRAAKQIFLEGEKLTQVGAQVAEMLHQTELVLQQSQRIAAEVNEKIVVVNDQVSRIADGVRSTVREFNENTEKRVESFGNTTKLLIERVEPLSSAAQNMLEISSAALRELKSAASATENVSSNSDRVLRGLQDSLTAISKDIAATLRHLKTELPKELQEAIYQGGRQAPADLKETTRAYSAAHEALMKATGELATAAATLREALKDTSRSPAAGASDGAARVQAIANLQVAFREEGDRTRAVIEKLRLELREARMKPRKEPRLRRWFNAVRRVRTGTGLAPEAE